MTKVLVTQSKLDTLAEVIGGKSNTNVPLTIDEMITAADSITSGGGTPTLETVTKTYTPSTSAVTDTITPSAGYDGIEEVDVTVSAVPLAEIWDSDIIGSFETIDGIRKWKERGIIDYNDGGFVSGTQYTNYTTKNAVPSGTTVTPSTSSQTIGGANYMMEGAVTVSAMPTGSVAISTTGNFITINGTKYFRFLAEAGIDSNNDMGTEGYISDHTLVSDYNDYSIVPSGTSVTPTESAQTIGGTRRVMEGAVTINAIPSNYVGSGVTQRTSSDLTASNLTVTAPSGYYSSNASKTLTDSNLVATNIKKDVVVFGVTGSYEGGGGGGSSVQVGYSECLDIPSATSSISFTGLNGEPTSFIVYYNDNLSTPSGTPYKVACLVYDGTDIHGQTITNTNNAQVTYDGSSFSKLYNNGTLTLSSSGAYFQAGDYYIIYSYDGTAGNIKTADVQVGSGATSITFTDLEDEPIAWYCIFKSNFSTSNGYQRVIFVTDVDGSVGMAMDSSAHLQVTWTSSYNNGSFTITSNGTNSGGYFHQPGYYQLTYVISGDESLQTKTVTPTTSTQNVTADTGYTALKKVVVNPIPSSYVQPTATKGATTYTPGTTNQTIASGTYLTGTQTISGDANLVAGNIKSGTTIFGVTGSYTGGGGGGSATVASTTWTNSSNTATSHQFTSLSGTPKAAFLRCTASLSRSSSSTNYFIADMVWTGTSCVGNSFRRSNGTYANVTSGYSVTTGTNSITFTSSGTSTTNPGSFYNGKYELVYVY